MEKKTKILVLCTGNSCRSQILHGFLGQNINLEVFSAGIETHGVNPRAIAVMKEVDIDISGHTSNNLKEYYELSFDYIITVCDNAKENCPVFPAKAVYIHKSFPDPAGATGTEEEIFNEFRKTRDMIDRYSEELIELIEKGDKPAMEFNVKKD